MTVVETLLLASLTAVKRCERCLEDMVQQHVGIPKRAVRFVCGLTALISGVALAVFGGMCATFLWILCPPIAVVGLVGLGIFVTSFVIQVLGERVRWGMDGRVYDVASNVYHVVFVLGAMSAAWFLFPGVVLGAVGIRILV